MKLSDKHIHLINVLLQNPNISISDLAKFLRQDYSVVYRMFRRLIRNNIIIPDVVINYHLLNLGDYTIFFFRKNYDPELNKNTEYFKKKLESTFFNRKELYLYQSSDYSNFYLINLKSKITKELEINNMFDLIKNDFRFLFKGYFLKLINKKYMHNFYSFNIKKQSWDINWNTLKASIRIIHKRIKNIPNLLFQRRLSNHPMINNNDKIIKRYLELLEKSHGKISLNKVRKILKINWNTLLSIDRTLKNNKIIEFKMKINYKKLKLENIVIMLLSADNSQILSVFTFILTMFPAVTVYAFTDFFDVEYFLLVYIYLPSSSLVEFYKWIREITNNLGINIIFFSYLSPELITTMKNPNFQL